VKIMRNKPTIAQVAERAQVAASTVSRVLNGGYASAEVKARVQQVISDLGYTPSLTARNLKMGRTGIIGVIVETSQGAWFTQLLGGIEERLVDQRISLVLASLSPGGQYDPTAVWSWIRERRVDGLIFARPSQKEEALVEAAAAARLPMAFIAPDQAFSQGPSVAAMNRAAGRELARHLSELGHERIAFAGGPKESLDTLHRFEGLVEGLSAQGLTPADQSFAQSYDAVEGVRHAERWLSFSRKAAPSAVVLGNDAMALAFMRTVQQEGFNIPEDVSVAGFDGLPEAGLYWPGLTTMAQPTRQMGMDACELLLSQIQTTDPMETVGDEYPMQLLARESTGPFRPAIDEAEPQRAAG
jgi:LacI family transcriptional regulator